MNDFTFKGRSGICTVSGAAKTRPIMIFKDCRGVDCSIRVAATAKETILVGCEKVGTKKLVVGEGMLPVHIPEPYIANTHMNLDKNMATEIIKTLQAFVEVIEETPTFDDLERTTIIVTQPEANKSSSATKISDLPEAVSPAKGDELMPILALEKAKTIKDTQEIINRLRSNRLQKAFIYLMGALSGLCIGSWTNSEVIAKAVIKFNLNRRQARKLRKMYRISASCGTPR